MKIKRLFPPPSPPPSSSPPPPSADDATKFIVSYKFEEPPQQHPSQAKNIMIELFEGKSMTIIVLNYYNNNSNNNNVKSTHMILPQKQDLQQKSLTRLQMNDNLKKRDIQLDIDTTKDYEELKRELYIQQDDIAINLRRKVSLRYGYPITTSTIIDTANRTTLNDTTHTLEFLPHITKCNKFYPKYILGQRYAKTIIKINKENMLKSISDHGTSKSLVVVVVWMLKSFEITIVFCIIKIESTYARLLGEKEYGLLCCLLKISKYRNYLLNEISKMLQVANEDNITYATRVKEISNTTTTTTAAAATTIIFYKNNIKMFTDTTKKITTTHCIEYALVNKELKKM